jgi:hypothetical protein
VSEFDQVLGQLDNGGTFRATRYVVELRDPEGRLLETYDTGEVSDVQRDGRVVTLIRNREAPVTVVAASIDDAGRLTDMVRSALPVAPRPPLVAPSMTADQRVRVDSARDNQSGCMIAVLVLVVVALLAALVFLAFDQDWIDFNGDTVTATPGPEPTATPESTPTGAPEPTPTEVPEEPTATPEPAATQESTPTP